MEDRALRRAFLRENAQDVRVGVPVVDDECLAPAFRDLDMRAERVFLRGDALGTGAEVVQARLADRADLRQGRQRVDLRQRLVQRAGAPGRPSGSP